MYIIDTNALDKRDRILLREIRSQAVGLRNNIGVRRTHPSYGVTKNSLRQQLAQLEGMLFAFGVRHLPDHGTASVAMLAHSTAEALNLDLQSLFVEVDAV